MDANFSQRIKDVLSYSKEEAVDWVIIRLALSIYSWAFCVMERDWLLMSC